jgi:hypothetical protein
MKRRPDPAAARRRAAADAALAARLREALTPPDTLPDVPARERIFAGVLARTGIAGGVTTVPAAGGDWRAMRPGVALKVLQRDPATGMASYLVRYDPGARVDRHPQGSVEECMLVSGDLRIDDVDMRPGDWQVALPGGEHGPLTSRDGALVFVRGVLRAVPAEPAPG